MNSYRNSAFLRSKFIKFARHMRMLALNVVLVAGYLISSAQAVNPATVDATKIEAITVVADEWYPMNGEPNSKLPGFMIAIAQQAATAWGASIQYRIIPWETALNLVGKGHFDCVIGAYKEDAPDFVFPKHHWGIDQMAFYSKKGKDWQFNSFNDLAGQQVGIVTGYSYGDDMDKWLTKHASQVSRIGNNDALEQLLLMLVGERIDLVLESAAVMMNKLKEEKLTAQVKQVGLLGGKNPLYLACSSHPSRLSRSRVIVEQMDQAFEQMLASKQLESILTQYGLAPWW